MMKLVPHHRRHISNRLAMVAAVLLLISTATGYDTTAELPSNAANATPSEKVDVDLSEDTNQTANQERRGLNLSLVLFRR
jgi:hypothetical protein